MLTNTTGVILAGGKSSRMGEKDKGLTDIAGNPLVAYVIRRMEPQVNSILISANRNSTEYGKYGYAVIKDATDEFYGPLSGLLSAMQHADTEYILTAPCDSPFLPLDYAQRMYTALTDNSNKICVAQEEGLIQPVFALVSCSFASSLQDYLEQGHRKAADWILKQGPSTV
ncbi:MAG: molybdenum cofactor guanylyltransferase, partial [Gammaproteobacteria bacterium]|nr:molybdenum cofactor guanylyltransferase [Gammaproteobacteria bacterium]